MLSRRMFSEEAASVETASEAAPVEEVVPPLAHNKFAHVFLFFYFPYSIARSLGV